MKLGTLALAALLVVASTPLAAARTATGKYTLSGPGTSCSPCSGSLGIALDVGGYSFPADSLGGKPVDVTVTDAGRGPVSFTVCQDLNMDGNCGTEGVEPMVHACAIAADLSASRVPFRATYPTWVLVYAVSPDCLKVATNGTITVSYAYR